MMTRLTCAVALAFLLVSTASADAQTGRSLVPPQPVGDRPAQAPAQPAPSATPAPQQAPMPAQQQTSALTYEQQVQEAIREGYELFRRPGGDPICLPSEIARAFPELKGKGAGFMDRPEYRELFGYRLPNGQWHGPKDSATERGHIPISERLWYRLAQRFGLDRNSKVRDQISEALADGTRTRLRTNDRRTMTPMIFGAVGQGSTTADKIQTIGFGINGLEILVPIRASNGSMAHPVFVSGYTHDNGTTTQSCCNIYGVFADTTTSAAPAAPPLGTIPGGPMDLSAADRVGRERVRDDDRRRDSGGWFCGSVLKNILCFAAMGAGIWAASELLGDDIEIENNNKVVINFEGPEASTPLPTSEVKSGSPPPPSSRPLAFRFSF